jgi:signal transduction histidine kinase
MLLNTKLKNVEIIKNYGKLSSINTLQGELNQVFMNILDNAIYACHKKDYIHNETPKIKLTTLQFNGMIQIKIYDNGIGMSDETVKKIYEPFFTNKPTGEGTGLGMYIVHGILQKLNGELNFETKKGLGTEITLTLKEI